MKVRNKETKSIFSVRGFYKTSPLIFSIFAILACSILLSNEVKAATLTVPSTQFPTVQSAINTANPGDTITLQAGVTFTESITLKYKSGNGYITIQTSALANLPPAGVRVDPTYSQYMPKITSANFEPEIKTEITAQGPSHHYKFIGVEIGEFSSNSFSYQIIELGLHGPEQNTYAKVAHDFVIDRCYIHAHPDANVKNGIALNSADTMIINSYISDIHDINTESHAIVGLNGTGRYQITNNYIEASSINVLFGGASPFIPNLVPSDILLKRNFLKKKASWRQRTPQWGVKNLLELKNARRVNIEDNIFDTNWNYGQNGTAVLFTVRNDQGTAPWVTVEDINFSNNIVRNVPQAISILGQDDLQISQNTKNLTIKNNLLLPDGVPWGGLGDCFIIAGNPPNSVGTQNLIIEHNTCVTKTGSSQVFIRAEENSKVTGLTLKNNIATSLGNQSIAHDLRGPEAGTTALNNLASISWSMQKNVQTFSSSFNYWITQYPTNNYYVQNTNQIGFTDAANGNFQLRQSSPYKNQGTDGQDPGANFVYLNQQKACIESGNWSTCSVARPSFDYDGDGKSDSAVFRPSSAVWYFLNSTNGFSAQQFGIATDKLVPADYDGDGKTDVAVYRNGTWYLQRSAQGFYAANFGQAGDVPVPADYTGDGKADPAVFRPSNRTWYIWDAANNQFSAQQFGLTTDRPVPADYDGDGKTDIAVYRNGVWYLNRSTQGVYAAGFGLPGDVPVPADYDGDGKAELAVFRPTNGTWYFWNLTNNQFSGQQFGLSTDKAAPGDYDGDGKTDVALWRPSTGTWYLQQSSSGFKTVQLGTSGDQPITYTVTP